MAAARFLFKEEHCLSTQAVSACQRLQEDLVQIDSCSCCDKPQSTQRRTADRILDDVKAVAICGKTIRQDCCTIALRFRLRFVATHGGICHYILNVLRQYRFDEGFEFVLP